MAQKTIRIAPIADNFSQDDIRKAIGDIKIIRIHTGKNFAYVQLENQDDIQILEFTKPDNRFDQLDGAEFKKVEPTFKWGSISSDSSSIQQLKEQPQHFQKIQMSPSNSGQPNPQSLFTVSNCDVTILNQLKGSQIKSTVFGQFKTIDRVLKKGDKLIIQLLDPVQAQKFEQIFPNLQISALGKSAFVDLEAQNESNFATQWLEQHHKQEGVKDEGQKVLHEDIIPKIHKLTSMQDDWIRQQQKQNSGVKTESKYFDIAEHSEQHIKTKSQLPGVFVLEQEKAPGVFILEPQKIPDSRQQFLIPGNNAIQLQAARKKQEQEQHKKKLQEANRLRQLEQKRKIEQQKLRRENQQRNRQIQKEKQEREKKEREQREREQQEREKQQREQQEKERKEREQKQREQRQREHREKEQRQKEQREKELKEREQQKQQKEREQKQNQQRERQKKEREQKQKELRDKIERQRIAKQQQIARKSSQNLLKEGIQQGKKGLQNFLTNTNTEKISNLIGSEQKTPILFWSLVMIALFILLI